jgi:cytochrome c biogenesis protein CcmG/thiol:disulfide interchange protein DsbE
MSDRRQFVFLAAAATAMALIHVTGGSGKARSNRHFPDFDLATVANAESRVTLDSFSERPALVNVWASWCLACRTERPLLMDLSRSGRIAIYGVNYLDERDDAIRWLDYFGNPFVMSVFDEDGWLGGRLGVEFVPGTYLLASDGRILYGHAGPLDARVIDEEIWPRVAATSAGAK